MGEESLTQNFEIALEKIESLTEDNNHLMNEISKLKSEIAKAQEVSISSYSGEDRRFKNIMSGADKAMERYKTFLKKEFPNAKSKQTKRKSV